MDTGLAPAGGTPASVGDMFKHSPFARRPSTRRLVRARCTSEVAAAARRSSWFCKKALTNL